MIRVTTGFFCLVLAISGCTVVNAPAYDVVILNGTVYDGSGAPGIETDPPINSTRPKSPLWASSERCGN